MRWAGLAVGVVMWWAWLRGGRGLRPAGGVRSWAVSPQSTSCWAPAPPSPGPSARSSAWPPPSCAAATRTGKGPGTAARPPPRILVRSTGGGVKGGGVRHVAWKSAWFFCNCCIGLH